MKRKFLGIAMSVLIVLSVFPITAQATDSQTLLNNQIKTITEDAHSKIIFHADVQVDDWIIFDVMDIPKVSNGTFTAIPQEIGKKVTTAYYLNGIEQNYHKDGDFKPLFLVDKNLEYLKIGFLHANGETTIVDVNLEEIETNVINCFENSNRASYTVNGSCFLKKTTSGSTYTVESSGTTNTSKSVDDVYCSITTYMNGIRLGMNSDHRNNATAVSVKFITPPNQFPSLYEVQGTHFGFLGSDIVDYYSSDSKTFNL